MKRQAKPGEFRSNLHRGGVASLIKITPEERMTAIRAAKVMGLSVAGVDILRSNHGPLVMEVNSSPGLEGIEVTTGKDVAGMIIEHLERTAGLIRPGPRVKAETQSPTPTQVPCRSRLAGDGPLHRIARQQQPQRQAYPRLDAAT